MLKMTYMAPTTGKRQVNMMVGGHGPKSQATSKGECSRCIDNAVDGGQAYETESRMNTKTDERGLLRFRRNPAVFSSPRSSLGCT